MFHWLRHPLATRPLRAYMLYYLARRIFVWRIRFSFFNFMSLRFFFLQQRTQLHSTRSFEDAFCNKVAAACRSSCKIKCAVHFFFFFSHQLHVQPVSLAASTTILQFRCSFTIYSQLFLVIPLLIYTYTYGIYTQLLTVLCLRVFFDAFYYIYILSLFSLLQLLLLLVFFSHRDVCPCLGLAGSMVFISTSYTYVYTGQLARSFQLLSFSLSFLCVASLQLLL